MPGGVIGPAGYIGSLAALAGLSLIHHIPNRPASYGGRVMLRSRLLPLGLASAVALTLAACQDNSNPHCSRCGAAFGPRSSFARR